MDPADAGMDNPPEPAPVASPAVGDEPVAWRARYGDEVVREWCYEEASRLAALRPNHPAPVAAVGDVAELIERLNAHTCGCGGPCGQQTPAYIREAASRLAALQAEATESALQQRVEELTDEVARLRPIAKAAVELRLDADRERAATAAAEARERVLREALTEFGSSRVRDRVAKLVGCNADILQDVLQQEVRAALSAHKEDGDA
jgi:hypothetical protein